MTDLELAERKHKYKFGALTHPSVTTITGLLDADSKSARMAGAAAKIAREGGNYRAEWKAKADRGTRVHGYIENWLRGQDADVLPGDEGYLNAAESYLADYPHERLYVERIVVGDGWGGRLDTCGLELIEDWKTGSAYETHAIQQAAYAHGRGFAIYDSDGSFADLEPMPQVKAARCVYLHEDGSYDKADYPRSELIAAYAVFEGLLATYRWLKGREAA